MTTTATKPKPRQSNEWPTTSLLPHPTNIRVFGDNLEDGIEELLEHVKEYGVAKEVDILPFDSVTSDGKEIKAGTILKGHRCWWTNVLRKVAKTKVNERWDLQGKDPKVIEMELLSDDDPRLRRKETPGQTARRIHEIRKLTGKSFEDIGEQVGVSKATAIRADKIVETIEHAHPNDAEKIEEVLETEGIRPAAQLAEVVEKEGINRQDGTPRTRPQEALRGKAATEASQSTQKAQEDKRDSPQARRARCKRRLLGLKTMISENVGQVMREIQTEMGVSSEEEFTASILTASDRVGQLIDDLITGHFEEV